MFTDDRRTATEARAWGIEWGKYPPPKINKPPTAVIPEIAFVIDISGVWRAGETPQTEKYPVITDSEKMLVIVKMAGSAHAYPMPKKPKRPAERPTAFLKVLWKKFTYTGLTALC
jgi:hypothetical protein